MQYDWSAYRKNNDRSPSPRRRRRLPLLLFFLLVLAGVLMFNRLPITETEARIAPLESEIPPPPVPELNREVIEGSIQPGDTISSLLGAYFTPQEIHNLAQESRKTFPLSSICAGQPFKICLEDGDFQWFKYDIDREAQLVIRREENGFEISRVPISYDIRIETVRGTITSSLFDAVSALGENAELAISLADIFAYDVDFIRDLRHGDTFQAVAEKRFRKGNPAGYGRILAAEFTNQGKTYRAFLFKDGDRAPAYYDAQGYSRRTAFLRAPLSYSRISSGFSMRRFHPVTKTWRAHPAIDYAAPTGTPIMTVGDGKIVDIGFTNGNGNYIKIRHSNGYETMYLHMSRFAKGMKQGRRVNQGEVIGYVGATGLATGPHLCFRMTKNGAPVNPTTVRSAAASPISAERLGDFKAAIVPLVAQLEGRETRHAHVEPEGGEEQVN